MLSGTTVGFISVIALLCASILMAVLDRKEKRKGRMALWLFIAAFVGGVVVTLVGGTRPREEQKGPMVTIGQVDEKEFEALRRKVAADPRDVASRERLGHLYLQQQDFENVFRMAHEALQLDPKSVESRVHMGMVLFAMGNREQAVLQFDQALQIDPKNAEALRFKGMVESADEDHIVP